MKLIPILFSMLVAGCVATDFETPVVMDSQVSEDESVSLLDANLPNFDIGPAIKEVFENIENQVNGTIPSDAGFEISVTSETAQPVSGTDGEVTVKSRVSLIGSESIRHVFSPGDYLIDNAAGKVYVLAVTNMVAEAVTRFGDHYHIFVLIDYVGAADGIPMRDGVTYRGEFNTVDVNEEELLVNGYQPAERFELKPGDPIRDNRDLAILRAYSMKWHFLNIPDWNVDGIVEHSRFIATTYNETGGDFRFAEVVIRVKQKPLNITRSSL